MGLFQLSLLVAVCLHVCLNGPEHYNGKPSGHPFVQLPFTRKHFLKRRISYSLNCDATFQLELLQDGDINPNPGPDRQISSISPTARTRDANVHGSSSAVQRINYTPTELLQWKGCKSMLLENVIDTIKLLGIDRKNGLRSLRINRKKKTRRGTRGGLEKRVRDITGTKSSTPISYSWFGYIS